MRNLSRLTLEERQILNRSYYDEGKSQREIARKLGRNPSTISRELKRNKHHLPRVEKSLTSLEKASYAHRKAQERLSKSRRVERLRNPSVRQFVLGSLIDGWSPEQIAGHMKTFNFQARVCFKTIYNYVRHGGRALTSYLRRKGKKYRQRVTNRRGRFQAGAPEKTRIDQRSSAANDREEFGHWEADTVHSNKGGKRAVLSLRERLSRERFFFIIPNLEAQSVIRVLLPFFQKLPAAMRLSITFDNGSEFCASEMLKLTKVMPELKVFYCYPHRAYERGAVENANGELRQFFPKGTDFLNVTQDEIIIAKEKLNNRPMKILNYFSSTVIFKQAIAAAI